MPPQMLSAQSRVEQSKQDQRVKLIEQSANAAVTALERIERALRAPELKRNPAIEPIAKQIAAIAAGLGEDGVLRRNLLSILTTPESQAPKDRLPPDNTQLPIQ